MIEHYWQTVPGWFHAEGLYRRMVEGAKDGSLFIEIGSWKGRSASFMGVEIANSGKKIDFWCVDTWAGSPELMDDSVIPCVSNIKIILINPFSNYAKLFKC